MPRGFQKPRCVARHEVDFEVEPSAGAKRSERRDFQRVRDDQHGKRVAVDLVDGQRNAIERDRALRRDEARQLAGTRNDSRAMSVKSSRAISSARPSTWPLTRWPPSSSPSRSARSRLSLVPRCQAPAVVTRKRLGGGIDRKPRAADRLARARPRSGMARSRRSKRRYRWCRDHSRRRCVSRRRPPACSLTSITSPKSLTMPVNTPSPSLVNLPCIGADRLACRHIAAAAIASAPSAAGPRAHRCHRRPRPWARWNSTASSTRSASSRAAASVGPPSTISRVMPRSAISFSAAERSRRPALSGARRHLDACRLQSFRRARRRRCPADDPYRRLPGRPQRAATSRRKPQRAVEHDAHRRILRPCRAAGRSAADRPRARCRCRP